MLLVASAVCVCSGRARDEGWGDSLGGGVGGSGRFLVGGGVGVCTVHRIDVIKCRVVPALP